MSQVAEQAALFAADIEQLRESHARLTEATIANTSVIGKLESIVGSLVEAHLRTEAQMAALAHAQARSETRRAQVTERLAEVAERLDAFLIVVETHMTGNNAGETKPE